MSIINIICSDIETENKANENNQKNKNEKEPLKLSETAAKNIILIGSGLITFLIAAFLLFIFYKVFNITDESDLEIAIGISALILIVIYKVCSYLYEKKLNKKANDKANRKAMKKAIRKANKKANKRR